MSVEEVLIQFFNVGLTHYLLLSLVLFCIGILGLIISRNIIRVLMSIEIILSSVNVNFVAFANYTDLCDLKGQVFAIFIMAVAAAEAALGLALLLALYRNKPSVDTETYKELNG
ncbi:MAG TPA: NADH-quinone oxidoreductase subunit NuoK [Candidatus Gastranaerophilales bacterium]|nr:NADH-quinone oxidoreductase subunit NuoK [Candidatus Gastranaerophilales bacterium]